MKNEYTWITRPEPKGIICAITKKDLRAKIPHQNYFILRINFRWQRVYCAIFNNEILAQPGSPNIPVKMRHLIVEGEGFLAIGTSDPYAPFNSYGADPITGIFTPVGRSWQGAEFDRETESNKIN